VKKPEKSCVRLSLRGTVGEKRRDRKGDNERGEEK
jgi:hypothetical protein